jgi:GNAT superfamily N-acetyltransferase
MLREIGRDGSEWSAFVAALEGADLAVEDLHSEPFRYFSAEDTAWGGIGFGTDALLRSVVVLPHMRGSGLAERLVEGLAAAARDQGTRRLWLLTLSAAPFFERRGWRSIARAEAPPSIAGSRQFSSLCPASATLMVRTL